MNPDKVTSEVELQARLMAQGFTPTDERTETGTFWVHTSGAHVLVPDALFEYYPNWMTGDLYSAVDRILKDTDPA